MLRVKYYNSIDDLPAHNYFKVIDENAFHLLIKNRGFFGDVSKAFENIQRQLVDRFGISEQFAEILELERELCELKCELHITGDRFINNEIRMREYDLKKITDVKSLTNAELKIIIEKFLGFKLNLHEISIAEWFEYLNSYSKMQPKQSE